MLEADLITCQQTAAILGQSTSTISPAQAQGRLPYGETKRKLIYRPGLEQGFANSTRRKADAPHVGVREKQIALSPEPQLFATYYWQRLADKLSFVLEVAHAYWSKAPDAHHLRQSDRTLDDLRSQVVIEGLEP